MPAEIALGLLVFWCICAVAGGYVANEKRREPIEGAVLGFLFGPIGLVVASLLPTKGEPAAAPVVERMPVERMPEPRPRRIKADRDDVAMDFVMDLVRQSEAENKSRGLRT